MSLNFEYRFYINTGSGFVQFEPEYEAAGVSKDLIDGEIFARLKITGDLIFTEDEYNTLLALIDEQQLPLEIRTYDGSETVIATGQLNLLGNYDDDQKKCSFDATATDEYTTLLEDWDTEYNVLNSSQAIRCFSDTDFDNLEFKEDINFQAGSLFKDDDLSISHTFIFPADKDIYARQNKTFVSFQADELIGTSGWELLTDNGDTKTLVRDWVVSFAQPDLTANGSTDYYQEFLVVVDIDPYPYNINEVYTILNTVTGDNEQMTYIGRQFQSKPTPSTTRYAVWFLRIDSYYGGTTVDYNRFRNLQDVIRFLVNNIDSTIKFDHSGTSTDSFYYLKTFEKNGEYPYLNLLIQGISDTVLSGGTPDSNPSTKLNLSLKTIFDFFKQSSFKIWWQLELRSLDYYFVIKHRSEINKVLGSNPDLTDLYNENWTTNKSVYQYDNTNKVSRITRESINENFDFFGVDLTFSRLTKTFPETLRIQLNDFFLDIWDIQNNSEKYPENSIKNAFIASADQIDDTEILTLSWTNASWDTFTEVLIDNIIMQKAAGVTGRCWNGTYSIDQDSGYVFVCNAAFTTYGNVTIGIYNNATGTVLNSQIETIEEGYNKFVFNPTQPIGSRYLVIKGLNTDAIDLELSDIQFELYDFNIRIRAGELTGDLVANADLSTANLDADSGLWELPDNRVSYNNEVDEDLNADRKKKDRLQIIDIVPIRDPNDIDFDELVKTDLAELEAESIIIKFNEAFAEFRGKF